MEPKFSIEEERLQQRIFGSDIPKIYGNGFLIGLTLSDLNITLTLNNQPKQQVILSLISAKALMEGLQQAITDFEKKTNTVIPKMEDLKTALEPKKS